MAAVMLASTHSIDVSIKEKTLSFIKEVIQIDLSKYNVEVKDYFEDYSKRNVEKAITYTPKGAESRLTIICRFANEILYYCAVYADEGKVTYNRHLQYINKL